MMFTLNNCPIKSSSSSLLFIRLNLNGRIDGSLQPTQSGLLTGVAYPYPVGRSLWWILSAGLILMSEVDCELFFCSPWIASEVIMRFLALLFLLFARKTKDNKNILIIYSTAYLHYKNIIENRRRRDKKEWQLSSPRLSANLIRIIMASQSTEQYVRTSCPQLMLNKLFGKYLEHNFNANSQRQC